MTIHGYKWRITHLKFNMAPEKWWLEDYIYIYMILSFFLINLLDTGSLLSGTPAPPWANRSLGRNFGSVEKTSGWCQKTGGEFHHFLPFRSSSLIKPIASPSPTKSQHKPPGNHEMDLRSPQCWDMQVIYTVEDKADKDTWDTFMISFWMSLHVNLAQPSATTTLCKS